MGLKLVTPPASEPITLAEAKLQLGVTGSTQDDAITLAITAARTDIENRTNLALITQTWDQTLDEFPTDCDSLDRILLRRYPVISITGLFYYDADGVEQTVDTDEYVLDNYSDRHWLVRAAAITAWPTIQDRRNSVRVRFVAGYGSTAASVPAPLRMAILANLSAQYTALDPDSGLVREDIVGVSSRYWGQSGAATINAMSSVSESLIRPYIVYMPEPR